MSAEGPKEPRPIAAKRHTSWWFLFALPLGLTTWLMFTTLAVRDRSGRYAVAAIAYLCLALAPVILGPLHGGGELRPFLFGVYVLALPTAWISGLVIGVIIDRRTYGSTFGALAPSTDGTSAVVTTIDA